MAVNRKVTNYEDFKTELLGDAETRKAYDALTPKYEVIKQLISQRNKLRISQTQLAKKVGLKQPAISRLERGNSNTTIGTLLKVTHALHLSIALYSTETDAPLQENSRL